MRECVCVYVCVCVCECLCVCVFVRLAAHVSGAKWTRLAAHFSVARWARLAAYFSAARLARLASYFSTLVCVDVCASSSVRAWLRRDPAQAQMLRSFLRLCCLMTEILIQLKD